MMGHHARSESLFYYFRIEDQVPENHLLRLIDRHVSFDFVREKLKDSYSETGRPSIDPELLLRILLIGYLYGVTSERKLVEELQMHLAWRWFTGLSFDQEIPHHSTFSKNRHGRFQESNLFQQLFEEIVDRCQEAGLVEGEHLSVDGSFIAANASRSSRIPREQLAEVAHVKRTVREYLTELEQENPVEEPTHQQDQVSTTDPDSTYATKGSRPAELGVLQQLSGRQPQRSDRGSASDGGSVEPGKCRGTGDDHAIGGEAGAISAVGGRRHGLREWRAFGVAGRAPHHSLYSREREPCSAEPVVWHREVHLRGRNEQLSMSGRKAADLRGDQCAQSDAGVRRYPQALPRLPAKSAVHNRAVSADRDPRARSGAQTSARTGEGSGFRRSPTATAENRSTVCGAEEPDRAATAALAPKEIRARAVLPGGHGPEPETAGAVPEKEIPPTGSGRDLREGEKERTKAYNLPAGNHFRGRVTYKPEFFNSHSPCHK